MRCLALSMSDRNVFRGGVEQKQLSFVSWRSVGRKWYRVMDTGLTELSDGA